MRILVFLMVMSACSIVSGNNWSIQKTRTFRELRIIIYSKDSLKLSETDPVSYEKLTSEQRNEIIFMLAKGLSQPQIAYTASVQLKSVISRHLVTDPKVIPYLIEALDTTEQPFHGTLIEGDIHYNIFESLVSLTEHATGYESCRKHKPLSKEEIIWWKKWWETNKDKHPMIDDEFCKHILKQVYRVMRIIEKDVKPRYREFSQYYVPKPIPSGYSSIFYEHEYNPRMLATMIVYPIPKNRSLRKPGDPLPSMSREDLPWMLIYSGFSTPDGPGSEGLRSHKSNNVPKDFQPLVKTVYCEKILGSDVEIKVLLASKNELLFKEIENILKINGSQADNNTEESSPINAKSNQNWCKMIGCTALRIR